MDFTTQSGGSASVWVPESFEPWELLPAGLWKHRENAFVLVHWLKMNDLTRGERTYVDISHRTGRRLFSTHGWDPFVDSMLSSGSLECDGKYVPDHKGFGYRLGPSLEQVDLIERELKSERARQHLAKFAPAIRSVGPMRDCHQYILSCLYRMRVDVEALERYLRGSNDLRRHLARSGAMLINRGVHRLAVDAYHRVHTLPASLPRESRPALLLDGARTVERDVSCSQPLLLGAIVRSRFLYQDLAECSPNTGPSGKEGRKEEKAGFDVCSAFSSYPKYDARFCTCAQPNTSSSQTTQIPRDLTHYISICENGTHYPEVADAIGMPYGTPEQKAAAKVEWMCMAYGYDSHELWMDHWERYAARWPTIAEGIERLRVPSYKNVSHTLQRVEADVMISHVCGTLMAQGIPVLPVHDSIRTICGNESVADRAIVDGYGKYGVVPSIK